MLVAGKKYKYVLHSSPDMKTSPILIDHIIYGIAYGSSPQIGDLGVFTMTFNAETGEGTGLYIDSHLEM